MFVICYQVLVQGRQDLIEGDIIADGLTKQYVNQANPDARNAIAWTHGVWPGGIVPYVIDGSIGKCGHHMRGPGKQISLFTLGTQALAPTIYTDLLPHLSHTKDRHY